MSSVIRTRKIKLCPLCKSKGDYAYKDLEDMQFGVPGKWSFRRCSNSHCQLLWLDPAPIAEDLIYAYENYYTHNQQNEKILFNLIKSIQRLFIDVLLAPFGITRDRYNARLMYLQLDAPGRLLDVGCGGGEMLERLSKRGWNVMGLDFDAAAVDAGKKRGLHIHQGKIDSLLDSGELYDVITLSHVIEHDPNPIDLLRKCKLLLKPNGKIVLSTPNNHSFGHELYKHFWRGLEPPRHVQVFSQESITLCANLAGFENVRCSTTASAASTILLASELMSSDSSLVTRIVAKIKVFPIAIKSFFVWRKNPRSGEELFCTLVNRSHTRMRH